MSGAAHAGAALQRPGAVRPAGLARLNAALQRFHHGLMRLCSVALLGAALVLTYSVVARYVLKISTEWQDEVAVFLLVGATFMSSAFVQSYRGHVGIEALVGLLPPGLNRLRELFIDVVSVLFCGFFAYKSWTLFHEAWTEGQTTTSSWGPPLWIPYSTMAIGMTLLALQVALQLGLRLTAAPAPSPQGEPQ